MKNHIVIITGPTGVGKTELVLKLAERMSLEVVNADIGSFYTPLTVGTAKPDWKRQTVSHHLFDVIDEPKNFTVVEYRKKVESLIVDIQKRGNLPVIVGGSSFYINALFFPPKKAGISGKRTYEESTSDLWEVLHDIDSVRAQEIKQQDRYRIERALDIWYEHGIKPSTLKPQFDLVADCATVFFLTRTLADLYDNINKRTQLMISDGWIKETEELPFSWQAFLLEKKIIGYDDIIRYLRGEITSKKELIEAIQQKTRRYAKRQLTFNRMLTKKFEEHCNEVYTEWINMRDVDSTMHVEVLVKKLKEEGYVGF